MTTTVRPGRHRLPGVWVDWCSVTGAPVGSRDEATLRLFSRQTSPSRRVLAALRPVENEAPIAPAWPAAYRDDPGALQLLVRRGDVLVQAPSTHWIVRLRPGGCSPTPNQQRTS